jgi:hypothetical protein
METSSRATEVVVTGGNNQKGPRGQGQAIRSGFYFAANLAFRKLHNQGVGRANHPLPPGLPVCFLMAFHALHWRLFSCFRFFAMAIDADACLGHAVMKRQFGGRLHWSGRGLGMTALAFFLGGFRGLLRLRGMVTGHALFSSELCVRGVVELHAPDRIALQDNDTRRLALSLNHHNETEHTDDYGRKYSNYLSHSLPPPHIPSMILSVRYPYESLQI